MTITSPDVCVGVQTVGDQELRIPRDLNSVHAVNYVLTQEPGKLKIEDIKLAIKEHAEAQAGKEQTVYADLRTPIHFPTGPS